MNNFKIDYSKSKEELYEWIKEIFTNTKNLYENETCELSFPDYFDLWFGVYYKDKSAFECAWMDVQENIMILEHNYYLSHTIDGIDWLFVINKVGNDVICYISDITVIPDVPTDNSIYSYFQNHYTQKYKYICFLEDGDELYDTYNIRRYNTGTFI